MSRYYRREQIREMLFVKSLHLKSKRDKLIKILPAGCDFESFQKFFIQYYPCEWDDIKFYCKSKRQDYVRRTQKNKRTIRFVSPEQFLEKHINLKHTAKDSLSVDGLSRLKKALQANADKKRLLRAERLEKNMVTIQDVSPTYASRLIKLYFSLRKKNTLNVNARYLILLEVGQFRCDETVEFFHKVNACEKNDDLRYMAFLSLQRMGEMTWLVRKRKGRKRLSEIKPIDMRKNPTELFQFICKYQDDIYQEYDVFLSHSSLDKKELLEIKMKLNRQGKSVYIDWVNDYIMLDRRAQNEDTWNVLEKRMIQSKQMIYVLTENSVKSAYAEQEVKFFKMHGKPVFVYQPHICQCRRPTYLNECPDCQVIK